MKVYLYNINNITKEDEEFVKTNFPIRFSQALKFSHKGDYFRCLGALLLLCKVLGEFKEEHIYYNEYQKPFIKGKNNFNYSHSGDYVCLVVSNNLIGVDIELIKPERAHLADKLCSPEELNWIKSDRVTRFFYLWCQKESVMKAVGMGFNLDPNSFDIFPFETNEPVVINNKTFYNFTFKFYEYVVSVSSELMINKIEVVRL